MKRDAHRGRHLGHVPCGQEFSGSRFDAERYDRVGILVGTEEEPAARIDPETARGLSPGWLMPHVSQPTGPLANPIDDDTVMPPV